MPKFRFEKVVNKEQSTVFNIFTDYNKLAKIAPDFFSSIRIRSSRDNVSVIEENLNLDTGIFVMMTKHVIDYPTSHKIFVIGGDSKGTVIEEAFSRIDNNTRVSISIDFKLSGKQKLLNLINPKNIEKNFTSMYDEIVKFIES